MRDDAKLNLDQVIHQVTAQMTEVLSRTVKHVPERPVDGKRALRGRSAFRGDSRYRHELDRAGRVLERQVSSDEEVGRSGSSIRDTFG